MQQNTKPFFVSIPHSGERVPKETPWLNQHPETLLMYDVDRYVDRLYEPTLKKLNVPFVKTEWHRYAIDLNRLADDVDCDSVAGDKNPSGKFPRGLHWSITTSGEKLMPKPMPRELHDSLVVQYFEPFHAQVRKQYAEFKVGGAKRVFHLDAHSMPSKGTSEHRDPGETRKDAVISDCHGKSCSQDFLELVIRAYKNAGLSIAHNWPYFGGRVSETYGQPQIGQEAIQVELSRALYMDEKTKQLVPEKAAQLSQVIEKAVQQILSELPV
jgi:N-formylglutamate deformylase